MIEGTLNYCINMWWKWHCVVKNHAKIASLLRGPDVFHANRNRGRGQRMTKTGVQKEKFWFIIVKFKLVGSHPQIDEIPVLSVSYLILFWASPTCFLFLLIVLDNSSFQVPNFGWVSKRCRRHLLVCKIPTTCLYHRFATWLCKAYGLSYSWSYQNYVGW